MFSKNRLQNYIVSNFGAVFFPIFFSLFTIASIIIFLRISSKTSFIKMTFLEMTEFYLYSVPEIMLYILPISFFASSIITLAKMSFDLELIVIFSLQSNVREILKPIIFLSIIVAIITLIVGFALRPQAVYKTQEFIYKKESSAEINIRPSEFGQKFGDWLLFVKEKEGNNHYKDVVLLSTDGENQMFIKSEGAQFNNTKGKFTLDLNRGQTYRFLDDSIEEIKFNTMLVNEQAKFRSLGFSGLVEYWKDIHNRGDGRKIVYILLTALFPVLSTLLVASLGIFNPRFQKNKSSFYIITAVVTYYVLTNILGKEIIYYALFVVPSLWLVISYLLYKKKIRKYY